MPKTAKDYLDLEQRLEAERAYWKPQWQLVSEYIHQRRADFTTSQTQGAFIHSHLWSDDAVHMAETAASAFLGYIWSAGVESFKLLGNEKVFGKDKGMKEWWAEVTEDLQREMDEQEAGLSVALDESMLDLITIGTDGIFTEERNKDNPLLGCLAFEPWSVQQFALGQDATGRAAKFTRRREYTVEQMVEKYGENNVSKKTRELFQKRKFDEKVSVLHVIEPRPEKDRNSGSKAAKDMPIASVHIEVDAKKIIRNSGYMELPVACARLAKRLNESYGRGRGMNALPSIMLLNQVQEDYALALEQKLKPAMYQLHDAVSGNGFIDTSADAINILRVDKANPNVAPVGKLYDLQDTNDTKDIIEMLRDTISNHFMIDRLINLNNDVEMTKGEAFLRNAIRQSTLRSIVSRILLEKFDMLINTSFMICLRRNKFGYMPGDPEARAIEANGGAVRYLPQKFIDAMKGGEDLFTIEYLTPAARDMMAEEGQGMVEMLAIAGELSQFDETVRHRLDTEWTLGRLTEIKGADRRMWRKESKVQELVAQDRAAAQEAQQAAIAQATAGVAKDAAIAQNTLEKQ